MKPSIYISIFLLCLPFFSTGTGGDTLVIGIEQEPPFIIISKDIITNEIEYTGLSIDLWESIAVERGVAYRYEQFSDHLGLIRALDFEEIDLSINPIHVNEVRLKMLDVTQPYFVTSIGVAISETRRGTIGSFIKNFFSLNFLRIVLLLLLVIFIFGTILWAAERKENKGQFRPGIIGLFDGLWWSAVTMTTVGYGDKAPKTQLGRVIAMIWMFTAIIIISGFTAAIASALTVNSLSQSIEDLDDLRKIQNIGTVAASSSEDYLLSQDINLASVYADAEEALKALAKGDIEVLLYDEAVMDYFIDQLNISNKVSLLPITFNRQYRSFFLPKRSDNLNWVNSLVVRRTNASSWQELLKKYNLQGD